SRSSGPKLARPSARKPCSACHCFSTASMAARVSVGPRVGTRISPRMSLGPAASRQTHFVPPSSTPATSGASLIGIDARASAALMRDAWPSPRVLAAVVVVEPARVLRSQPFDQPPHGAHALLRRQRRAASAHVGLDPSGVDHDAGDALARQIDRSAAHHHVHRRLGRPVRNVAAGSVVRERPHAAGDRDYRPTRALSDPLEKRFGHARRPSTAYCRANSSPIPRFAPVTSTVFIAAGRAPWISLANQTEYTSPPRSGSRHPERARDLRSS